MDGSGSSGEGLQTGQEPNVIVRPLPIYGIWCKVFEEAIKFIFCSEVTTAESPDLANQNKQYFSFYKAGNSGWVAKITF